MIRRLETEDPKTRVEITDALADRQSVKAVPVLLETARDPDKSVRRGSFKALARLAAGEDIPAMVDLITGSETEIEKRLRMPWSAPPAVREAGKSAPLSCWMSWKPDNSPYTKIHCCILLEQSVTTAPFLIYGTCLTTMTRN